MDADVNHARSADAHARGPAVPISPLDPSRIPAALRGRPQWVCWKYVVRDGKPTKCPVNARTKRGAKASDPATWSSFDEAVATCTRTRALAGVGYVFSSSDPFTGIDLDGCIAADGSMTPSAREIVQSLNSYTEISPSGRGVKVFIRATKPRGARCRSKAVEGFKESEVYDHDRFFVVTSRRLEYVSPEVEARQAELNALCARLWPSPAVVTSGDANEATPVMDDADVIRRAARARNGTLFSCLWKGDISGYEGDRSSADLALCNLLAFWTVKDPDRIDRLFRQSRLMRPKWDARRGERTYGQMTIEKAIARCTAVYSSNKGSGSRGSKRRQSGGDAGAGGTIGLGQREPRSGRLVLSARRTLPTAEAFVREFFMRGTLRTLHSYAGLLMGWRHNRYCQIEEGALRHAIQRWLHQALCHDVDRRTGHARLVDFDSNPHTVGQALDSIRSYVHLSAATMSPAWLGSEGEFPATEILPCKSCNLHIPTGRVLPATPAFFTTNALDFDYNPEPEPPERWTTFLEQLFGDDLESVQLLQEWAGYCLIADTSQQKMLLVVGPRRSGKGTIGRILSRLVGSSNVAGPTVSSLGGPFGLQPLLDKSLAIVSDARFGGEHIPTVVERLLCISGEDRLTIDRKFLGAVHMKLPTRFMFLTNELPRVLDASTALAGRFLLLRLTNSFYGSENVTLSQQLSEELPGILLWAIEGWKRLKVRGYFVQPASSVEAIREMEDLAAPVGAFIRESCVIGAGHRVDIDDLYAEWQAWCAREGRTIVTSKPTFGRDLAAAAPGVRRRRTTDLVPFYEGIGLRPAVYS